MSTEAMSSKERLLAALRHEETDRIPWSPLICNYYSLGLPGPLHGNDIAVQRAFGADIMERLYSAVYHQSLSSNVERRQSWKGQRLQRVYETPIGTLKEAYEGRDTSPWMMFPVEFKIKTRADLKTYRYIVEAQQYEPAYDEFVRASGEIGDDGLATTDAPVSPFQWLLQPELGVEQFHYFLADYSDEMEELMEVMHVRNLEACQVIAESPVKVVIIYDNTSTSYMSPYMYRRYILRHLNAYADLFHQAGKILLIHMCGKLKDVAEGIREGRYDGICDIAPPPTGDLGLAEAKQVWGDRLVAMGGIDATAFAFLSPEDMKEHVRVILERIAPYRGVILGSGDAVPLGTPLETLRAVTETVSEFKLG